MVTSNSTVPPCSGACARQVSHADRAMIPTGPAAAVLADPPADGPGGPMGWRLRVGAAVTSPGGDVTLPTTAVLDGDSRVVLVGGGDMMLAAGAGNPDAVNGRAGLGDLGDQVAAKVLVSGRTTVTLGLDDTLFTGPAI